MRHGKRFNHLGRTTPHRKAMLSNMASSLILHKRINTTVAKAKALRRYVEPLLTKSKTDTTHSRRVVFSYLQDKESVKELFDEVSEKIAARPGGYTRIIKMGNRLGDNADMCMIELVDYNELMLEEKEPKKAKTRRSRRSKKSTEGEAKDKSTTEEVKAEKVETTNEEVKEEKAKEEDVKAVEEKVVEEKAVEEKSKEIKAESKDVKEKAQEEPSAPDKNNKSGESEEKTSGKE